MTNTISIPGIRNHFVGIESSILGFNGLIIFEIGAPVIYRFAFVLSTNHQKWAQKLQPFDIGPKALLLFFKIFGHLGPLFILPCLGLRQSSVPGFQPNTTPAIVRQKENSKNLMASGAETYPDSTNLKLRELLKEVQLDYSPENTAIIHDTVSAIRVAIDNIPDGLLVHSLQLTFPLFLGFINYFFLQEMRMATSFCCVVEFTDFFFIAANFGRLQLMLRRGLFEMLVLIKSSSSSGSPSLQKLGGVIHFNASRDRM